MMKNGSVVSLILLLSESSYYWLRICSCSLEWLRSLMGKFEQSWVAIWLKSLD